MFVSRMYMAIPLLFLLGLGIVNQSFLRHEQQTPFKSYTASITGTQVKFDNRNSGKI